MERLDWDAIDELFQAALAVPTGDRHAWIAARTADDTRMRREVESLVRAHEGLGGFLDPLVRTSTEPTVVGLEGARIGAYELVRELGRGGMGTVYLGRRTDGAFAHEVAIKLTHSPVPSDEIARRFDAERRILASLRHRNIVTLLDGGTTPSGHPYLITEYVEGLPLTTFASQHRLVLEDRLRLFRQVCAAVHAAHQNSVVHRDLKPANILVTTDGSVKVLDFGVAKLLTPGASDLTQSATQLGPLTPNYASPEQLRGARVTTASDVYALGVLLFELVAGVRPREATAQSLEETLTDILKGPVVWPSASARRSGDLPYGAARLEGDLDAIVLKAMRADPDERYGSADELSQDIGRFLDGHPVVARRPSFGYLAAKLARRHRAAVAVATLALMSVVAATAVALWQRQQADRARAVAETRSADLRTLATTLIFTLDEAVRSKSPTEARKIIVSEALRYLDSVAATSSDPHLSVELAEGYLRVGQIQGNPTTANLGDARGAASSAKRALALAEPLEATPLLRNRALAAVVEANRLLAMVTSAPESVEAARRAVAVAERWRQQDGGDAARAALGSAHFNLALKLPWPEQRTHWEAAGREYDALLAEQPDNPTRMRNVALVDKYLTPLLRDHGEPVEAGRRAERAAQLDTRRLELRPADRQARLDAAMSLSQLSAYRSLDERLPLLERSVALREQVTLEDPADYFSRAAYQRSWVPLARARIDAGDLAGARAALERALSAYAAESPTTMQPTDRYWRGRVYLLLSELDGLQHRPGAGCRWLQLATTEMAASVAAGGSEAPGLIARESARVPGCRVGVAPAGG